MLTSTSQFHHSSSLCTFNILRKALGNRFSCFKEDFLQSWPGRFPSECAADAVARRTLDTLRKKMTKVRDQGSERVLSYGLTQDMRSTK